MSTARTTSAPRKEDYNVSDFDILIYELSIMTVIAFVSLFIFLPKLYLLWILTVVIWLIPVCKAHAYLSAKNSYEELKLRQEKDFWYSLDGWAFERELSKLYRRLGCKTTLTKGSGDGGVDIILKHMNKVAFIQCKAYKKSAGPAPIRELYGVMKSEGVSYGIVACLRGFSSGAVEFAAKNNIKLLDVNDIIKMSEYALAKA